MSLRRRPAPVRNRGDAQRVGSFGTVEWQRRNSNLLHGPLLLTGSADECPLAETRAAFRGGVPN
jgi:hypothetical protein